MQITVVLQINAFEMKHEPLAMDMLRDRDGRLYAHAMRQNDAYLW